MGEDPFSIQWTREAIEEVVDKGIGHVSQVSIRVGSTRAGTQEFDAEPRTLGSPSRLGTRGVGVFDPR